MMIETCNLYNSNQVPSNNSNLFLWFFFISNYIIANDVVNSNSVLNKLLCISWIYRLFYSDYQQFGKQECTRHTLVTWLGSVNLEYFTFQKTWCRSCHNLLWIWSYPADMFMLLITLVALSGMYLFVSTKLPRTFLIENCHVIDQKANSQNSWSNQSIHQSYYYGCDRQLPGALVISLEHLDCFF